MKCFVIVLIMQLMKMLFLFYDSILDIIDENKYVMFESNLLRIYLETLNNVHKYNKKCKTLIELKNSKIPYDVVNNVISEFL